MDTMSFLTLLDSAGFTVLRLLLSVLWQSTIVLAAAGALTWFLRRRGDRVRHIIWTGAVCIIPLLPLLTWGAAMLGSPLAEIQVIQPYTAPLNELEQQVSDDFHSLPSAPSSSAVLPIPVSPLDYPWALGLVGYLLTVSAMLFWMTVGRLRIRRWILDGEAVIDPRVLNTFHETGELLGIRREYPVIENQTIPAPVTCRVFHPVIILPSGFSTELIDIELHAVALHELMHVKRRDTFVFTVVSFIRAMFFFQPLVWVACRRISYLAELACDSAVLDSQKDPAAYAELLTRIAFHLPDRALSTELAAGILLSNSSFFHRIREILSDRSDQVKKLSRLALGGLLLAGTISLALAVAFPLGEVTTKTVKESGELKNEPTNVLAQPATPTISEPLDSLKSMKERSEKGKIDTINIFGIVTYDGKPVAGAEIFLYHSDFEHPMKPKRMTESKSDGNFSFVIADSMYVYWHYVFVTHPRYSIGWKVLKPDAKDQPFSITLYNPSSIGGKVIDKDMKPIKGVIIRMPLIIGLAPSSGSDILTALVGSSDLFLSSFTTISDKNGSFIFKNLPEGAKVDLTAIKPGYARYLESGAFTDSNLSIVLRPEGRISGRIISGETGLPVKNVEIGAGGLGNNWGNSGTTDREGNYTITKLSAGYHNVYWDDNTNLDWTAAAQESVKVEEGKETKQINLKLIKGGIITGKVLDSETGKVVKPNKYSEVSIYGPSRPKSGDAIQSAPIQPDGSYQIRVAPGKNYIYLQTYSRKLKEKMQFHWVDVKEGETVPDINFYVKKDSTATQNSGEKVASLKTMKDEMIEKEAVVIRDEKAENELLNIYISQAWGMQLKPPDGLKRAVINLAEAVNRYTYINAKVDTHLYIDSQKIFETPFVYIVSDNVFKLTGVEPRNFGQYLRNGGFAFFDNCASMDKLDQVEAALKQMIRDSLGSDAKFLPIPNDHSLFHCFFDFNDGPPGGYENHITKPEGDLLVNRKIKLEGIWLDNRLAIIYSNNGYSYKWNENINNDPQLKFGVNLVVYALTEENGIGYKKYLKSKP